MLERGTRMFISWEPSNSRSDTLAKHFAAECFHVHFLSLKKPLLAPAKYVLQTFKSWQLLLSRRPRLVFIQNPPLFAALAVWGYSLFFRCRFVLDSHTGAFLERKWKWLSPLHGFVARRAVVSIVTNEHLGQIVKRWKALYYVFADVPTEFPDAERLDQRPERFVTVINSFSYDEPLKEVLEAAAYLPDVSFAVTGDVARCSKELLRRVPPNVTFTGFVSKKKYIDTVYSSDAVVVLTKENHTMQRGAYEAMSLGVPIVTSDWPILRATFSSGTIHTDNSADAIAAAIRAILENNERFRADIAALKVHRRQLWTEKIEEFAKAYLSEESDLS